jgi:hypothetical protein
MKKIIFILTLLAASCSYADRAYMILPVQGGSPVVGEIKANWSLIEMYKASGMYQVTGTAEAISALSKLPGALLITTVTEASTTKEGEVTVEKPQYSELSAVVKVDLKTTNDLMTAEMNSVKEPITDKDTNREAILKMVKNKNFEKDYWVKE